MDGFRGNGSRGADPYNNRPLAPKGIKELPRFIKELVTGFFFRFGYIVKTVWKTGPWILITMVAVSVLSGVLPVVG